MYALLLAVVLRGASFGYWKFWHYLPNRARRFSARYNDWSAKQAWGNTNHTKYNKYVNELNYCIFYMYVCKCVYMCVTMGINMWNVMVAWTAGVQLAEVCWKALTLWPTTTTITNVRKLAKRMPRMLSTNTHTGILICLITICHPYNVELWPSQQWTRRKWVHCAYSTTLVKYLHTHAYIHLYTMSTCYFVLLLQLLAKRKCDMCANSNHTHTHTHL